VYFMGASHVVLVPRALIPRGVGRVREGRLYDVAEVSAPWC
jgi:hypothetical protein